MKTRSKSIQVWGAVLLLAGLLLTGSRAFGQQAYRFVTMADCRGSSDSLPYPKRPFIRIVQNVDSLHPRPNLWFFGGDAYYSAADSDTAMVRWQVWKNDIAPIADIPYYISIGNHEANTYYGNWDGAGPFKASFPQLPTNGPAGFQKLAYTVRYSNSLFLIVDTDWYNDASRVNLTQRNWLSSVLDTTSARHKFVLGHEEAYPPSGSTSSSLQYYPTARDSFWNILTSHQVDAYICGHIHLWNQDFFVASGHGNQPPDHSVRQVINGSCGAGLVSGYGGYFYHYVVWDIHGDTVRALVYDTTGNVRDSLKYIGPSGVEEAVPVVQSHEPTTLEYHHGTIFWLEEPDDFPEVTEVTVFNIQGQKIWSGTTTGSSIYWGERSRSGRVASGIYLVRLKTKGAPPGATVNGKIVVVH